MLLNIIIIALLVVGIRTFVVAPFQVSGPSMCDTLNVINGECVPTGHTVGEFMLINKFSYIIGDPQRGDVIVFKPSHSSQFYIKRIIGVPGDKVEIKPDNFVYLTPAGGEEIKLSEPYLNEENYGNTRTARENMRVFNVPEEKYFVMGDNRMHSSDSRHCFSPLGKCQGDPNDTFLSPDEISGKAFITLWPLKNIKLVKRAEYGF